jgi:hypothetical protein
VDLLVRIAAQYQALAGVRVREKPRVLVAAYIDVVVENWEIILLHST